MYILIKIVLIVISTYLQYMVTGKDFQSMAIKSIETYNNL